MLKKITTAVVLVTACGFAGVAMAQSNGSNGIKSDGFYLDGNLGWGKTAAKNKSDSAIDKTSGFAWNASVGYKFMPFLGAQVGYLHSPKAKYKDNTEMKDNYLLIAAVKGIIPLEDGFSLNGVTGPAWGHTKLSSGMTLDGTAYNSGSHRKFTWYFGLGADYNLTESFYLGVGVNYSLKSKPVPAMYSVTGNVGFIF